MTVERAEEESEQHAQKHIELTVRVSVERDLDMQSDIGRFLESHRLEMQQLIRVVYDACCGQGSNVVVTIQGKELVFSTQEDGEDFGFVRLMPFGNSAILSFPEDILI